NESAEYGQTAAGTDYWFVYNNTLFMDINSNDLSTAEHKAFMEEAIAANPDVTWKTVIFHHSVYSTASHTNDDDIIQRRAELPPVFDELGIDVVLMGHDHVYTRTYMMNGTTPDTSNGVQSEVTNPDGVLYLTANSASGSKYYDIQAPDAAFSAVMDQSYRRTVTDVEITDTSYTLTTYYADDMSVLDTFTINKTTDEDVPGGDDDNQGNTGDNGNQGNTGNQGNNGNTGNNGNVTTGSNGNNGSTGTNGNNGSNAPKTGDQTSVASVIIMLVAAGCVVAVIARRKLTV
ncbi:MAG TPA: metallophosphoesterase, partial [Candidatus Mediterraneibacter stercoripullorum]|nr:metallophosphoesterase [Candidatus Mediterraneibacter stercoripullorum]